MRGVVGGVIVRIFKFLKRYLKRKFKRDNPAFHIFRAVHIGEKGGIHEWELIPAWTAEDEQRFLEELK